MQIQYKFLKAMQDHRTKLFLFLFVRTGSGKTGAFAVPTVQKILASKSKDAEQSVKALMLAPSRELARQIHE